MLQKFNLLEITKIRHKSVLYTHFSSNIANYFVQLAQTDLSEVAELTFEREWLKSIL